MSPSANDQMASYPDLRGRVVLVTGGASGIGAEIVRRFAAQHCRVVFLDVDDEAAEALVADLDGGEWPTPQYRSCDLRDVGALGETIAEVAAQLGPVEVLVNNAGNDDRHEIEDVDADYFDDRIAVNLRHYFFAIQAVREGMVKNGGGVIVNVGSIAWRLNLLRVPVYATAKAAIGGMTNVLAAELGSERIRVNCVEPGFVATERQRTLWLTPELEAQVKNGQCLPDLIQPESIADAVLFLASDAARMCTGQTLIVDAGWT